MSFATLREVIGQFRGRRVHVVGDTIVDSYTYTTMIGGQTKTPTMSVLYENRDDYIGGAAVVAKHLRAAGAEVVFSTVLGDDRRDEVCVFLVLNGVSDLGACYPIGWHLSPTPNVNVERLIRLTTAATGHRGEL